MTERPAGVPAHLPDQLVISLWDVAWYTRAQPGEAFDDLDARFAEAAERGVNTVRLSADPQLLFTAQGDRRPPVAIENLGGGIGVRTRWYDLVGGYRIDVGERLLELLRAARRQGCFVILSTWSYQQTLSFIGDREVAEEILAIPPAGRFMALAIAHDRLLGLITDAGLRDRIAYVEIHNEVEYSRLAEVAGPDEPHTVAMKPYLEAAIGWLRERHPNLLITCAFGEQTPWRMKDLPDNAQVAHHHLYIYGVLQELEERVGLWPEFTATPSDFDLDRADVEFPTPLLRTMLRDDAPPFEAWRLPADRSWKLAANFLNPRLFYVQDWVQPDLWDLWLYEHYPHYRESMRQGMTIRLEAIAEWAAEHQVPAVIGEGWVGYTPLLAGFEEGPVGKDVAEFGIRLASDLGFWGIVTCSNAAPHHPMWADVAWQRRAGRLFREGGRR